MLKSETHCHSEIKTKPAKTENITRKRNSSVSRIFWSFKSFFIETHTQEKSNVGGFLFQYKLTF